MADFRKPGDRSEPLNPGTTQNVVSGLVHRVADLEEGKMTDERRDELVSLFRQVVREELQEIRKRIEKLETQKEVAQ